MFNDRNVAVPDDALPTINGILQKGSTCELKITKEGLLILENRRKKVWPTKDAKGE